LQADQLLYRLFNEDDIVLSPAREIDFGCSCSRSRSEAALKLLGKEDLTALSNETDEITINCEMCGESYTWDSVEAHVLFETSEPRLH
jgi:molecular chaperone Hsp33